MTEQTLELSRRIDAPVAAVWEVLTDLSKAQERLSGVSALQIMTSGPYAVGTRWRETRTFFGMTATEEMWVRHNDPLRSTVVEASHKGTDYSTRWQLTSLPRQSVSSGAGAMAEATELHLTFTGSGPAGAVAEAAARVLGPVGLKVTRKAMEQDLDDIEAAASALTSG